MQASSDDTLKAHLQNIVSHSGTQVKRFQVIPDTPDSIQEIRIMADAAQFHWEDPLLLDQQLTEDERMVREAAAVYSQDRLQPRVAGGVPP
jgi:hypothetical protein